jgi:hypothetical protein
MDAMKIQKITGTTYRYGAGPFVCTVDLGKHQCGAALWGPRGTLVRADTVASYKVGEWVGMLPPIFLGYVYEKPQKYRRFRVAHPDLDALLLVAGLLDPLLAAYTPQAWKGNAPKSVHHRRLERALTTAERRIWDGLDHNARDAVGIGLYYSGRTQRGGLLPVNSDGGYSGGT